MNGTIPATSLTQQEFTKKKGDRFNVYIPRDSDIMRGDKSYRMETQTEHDYQKKKGERYEIKKPAESEIWKVI